MVRTLNGIDTEELDFRATEYYERQTMITDRESTVRHT